MASLSLRAFLYHDGKSHQKQAISAFADGLKRHGISQSEHDDADFVVTWGQSFATEKPRLSLEAGYINGNSGNYKQDRLRFISAGWNGMHGRADAWPKNCPDDRWASLGISLDPWKESGQRILVCDQYPTDSQAPPDRMWQDIRRQVGEIFSDVVFRTHPLAGNVGPLGLALDSCAVCITWSSSAAIEAVIRGVPTIAFDSGSMAWAVTSHSLSDPLFRGERTQWASDLAYRQYTLSEIADGTLWEYMRREPE